MASPAPHIFVCTACSPSAAGPSCGAGEGRMIHDRLPLLLAEAGVKGARVTACGCLGGCEAGANMVIYPEGVFYHDVTLENLRSLVQQHFVAGEPISELVARR